MAQRRISWGTISSQVHPAQRALEKRGYISRCRFTLGIGELVSRNGWELRAVPTCSFDRDRITQLPGFFIGFVPLPNLTWDDSEKEQEQLKGVLHAIAIEWERILADVRLREEVWDNT